MRVELVWGLSWYGGGVGMGVELVWGLSWYGG